MLIFVYFYYYYPNQIEILFFAIMYFILYDRLAHVVIDIVGLLILTIWKTWVLLFICTGTPPVLVRFRPWKTTVRLDIFHFMRRFTAGLTTEHHPLYATFCSKLSSCIYEWAQDDICRLKEAKRSELKKEHAGVDPTEGQVLANISSSELARHCRRRTRGVEETRSLIEGLLKSMWELTDTSGLRLINPESMTRVWETQQKHLPCIQDPPGVQLYTKIGSGSQKGDKVLDVFRCGRGSSSLESFNHHQCTFIPGN